MCLTELQKPDYRNGDGRLGADLKPAVPATEPGPTGFQPNHPRTTFLANISPKPSITPFTKGRARLIASAEKRARTRVLVDSEESKIARVADVGVGLEAEVATCRTGDEGSVRSGNEDGNEDVDAWTSSHF